MGIDLRLLPVDGDNYSHTVLNLYRSSELFEAIDKLPHQRMNKTFNSWCGDKDSYGETTEDCYGDPIRTVSAGDLLTIGWRLEPLAVRAYIEALDPDTRIVLYWH